MVQSGDLEMKMVACYFEFRILVIFVMRACMGDAGREGVVPLLFVRTAFPSIVFVLMISGFPAA